MTPAERNNAIAKADNSVAGALFRAGAPAWLAGMDESERELRRQAWRRSRHPDICDREQRLEKAVAALDRGGAALVALVSSVVEDKSATAAAAKAEAIARAEEATL